jgi:hypothetical protein
MVDENGTVPFWNGAEEKHTYKISYKSRDCFGYHRKCVLGILEYTIDLDNIEPFTVFQKSRIFSTSVEWELKKSNTIRHR